MESKGRLYCKRCMGLDDGPCYRKAQGGLSGDRMLTCGTVQVWVMDWEARQSYLAVELLASLGERQ